jgi:hypothetical protein
MARLFPTRLFFLALLLAAPAARGGDEDLVEPKKQVLEEKIPEDTAVPKEPEAPPPAADNESDKNPDFEEIKPKAAEVPAEEAKKTAEETPKMVETEDAELPPPVKRLEALPPPVPRKPAPPYDGDRNIDYSRLDDTVEASEVGRGVLPPALGFRGYRPNMIAVGGGDRVPGFGGIVEYSWNRIGAGLIASYHSEKGQDRTVQGFGVFGAYGLYRWLPFDMSPYFLLGLEAGAQTNEPFGGMLGLGAEARIYSGWTLLIGWTYHSVMERGYFGGAIGWSF